MTDSVSVYSTPLYHPELERTEFHTQSQFRSGQNWFSAQAAIPPSDIVQPLPYSGARFIRFKNVWFSPCYHNVSAGTSPNCRAEIEFFLKTRSDSSSNNWDMLTKRLYRWDFWYDDPSGPIKVLEKSPWFKVDPGEALFIWTQLRKFNVTDDALFYTNFEIETKYAL